MISKRETTDSLNWNKGNSHTSRKVGDIKTLVSQNKPQRAARPQLVISLPIVIFVTADYYIFDSSKICLGPHSGFF